MGRPPTSITENTNHRISLKYGVSRDSIRAIDMVKDRQKQVIGKESPGEDLEVVTHRVACSWMHLEQVPKKGQHTDKLANKKLKPKK